MVQFLNYEKEAKIIYLEQRRQNDLQPGLTLRELAIKGVTSIQLIFLT